MVLNSNPVKIDKLIFIVANDPEKYSRESKPDKNICQLCLQIAIIKAVL